MCLISRRRGACCAKTFSQVLLIHDADTDKEAAAMDVGVGQTSDPPNLQGTAHFCEHMLFLGTGKKHDYTAIHYILYIILYTLYSLLYCYILYTLYYTAIYYILYTLYEALLRTVPEIDQRNSNKRGFSVSKRGVLCRSRLYASLTDD